MERKRLLIVLYGAKSQGKTSTLMQLIINLAGGGSVVENSINSTSLKKGKYWDGRMIIKYEGHLIYIATGGDTWGICRGNTDFFESDFGKQTIYEVDATGVIELTSTEKADYSKKKKKPIVAVCACRPSGDNYGAIKALHAYYEHALSNYTEQLWIRKKKEDDNITVANEIQKRIDEFI